MNLKIRALVVSILGIALLTSYIYGRGYWYPVYAKTIEKKTVSDVINTYGEEARSRLQPYFVKAGIAYPPKDLAFLAIKDTDLLEVWASNNSSWVKVKEYVIQAASGQPGPKLVEGDRQVPEGIYNVIGLNPNSSYHLSMKLNYPNEFDQYWAQIENRTKPGSNIFIHGKSVSIGCLAMGDEAIEELFVLGSDTGISNIKVIITPSDPRIKSLTPPKGSQHWVEKLYQNIERSFEQYQTKIVSTP